MRDLLLRERAEIENQRKRLQRDLEQARKLRQRAAAWRTAAGFRQSGAGPAADTADAAALREGMDLTLKALLKVGENHGLKPSIRSGSRSIRNCTRR